MHPTLGERLVLAEDALDQVRGALDECHCDNRHDETCDHHSDIHRILDDAVRRRDGGD